MATAEQILDLRRLINEPTEDTYADSVLSLRIDEAGDIRVLAGTIWREKAATFAGMVDIKEGNSDRKLSQLYKQALEMASNFGASSSVVSGRVSRTRRIERQ